MRVLVLLFVVTFAACVNTPITQVSDDTYHLYRTDGSGYFGNPYAFRQKVLKEAQDFAASKGKVLVPVSIEEVPLAPGQLYKIDYRFRLIDPAPSLVLTEGQEGKFPATEPEAIDFYFSDRSLDSAEGIWTWDSNDYQVAITKNGTEVAKGYDYIGVIIRSGSANWKPGDVKLFLNSTASPTVLTGVYFDEQKRPHNLSYMFNDANLITVNESFDGRQPLLIRDYPAGNRVQRTDGTELMSTGTCFVVSRNGTAVTSHHVIEGASKILVVLSDGREIVASIRSSSVANDIAVLSLPASTPNYLSLVSTRSTAPGEQVFTVGFPTIELLGSEAKFSEGSISALSGIRGEAAYMQISVPIQPGNSGGPVVNYDGEVLGIVAATAAVEAFFNVTGSLPQNVNWAVKSDFIRPMIEETPVLPKARDRQLAITRAEKAVCRVSAFH
jgi:S1-C subfamily serine protease